MVNQLYMLTKVFFYKSGIIDRASDTEPKNHQNLWGEPLLPKFDDETQKKSKYRPEFFFTSFPILLVKTIKDLWHPRLTGIGILL